MNLSNAYVFDIEVYPNCFVLVARFLGEEKPVYKKFVLHESRDDYNLLLEFLRTKPTLIGYNNLSYDGQVIEHIYQSVSRKSTKEIYEFSEKAINGRKENEFNLPYSDWDLSFSHVDLFKINHFDNANKRTSLKWLEFSMRSPKMQDLPIPIGSEIANSSVDKIVSYCKNDVDNTTDFFYKCLPMIELRNDLVNKYQNHRIMNMSDSSIGEFVFKKALLESGISKKKLEAVTKRKTIAVADCILDYISFNSEEFNNVLSTFKSIIVDDPWENGLKGVHQQSVVFDDMTFDFGTGGLHAAYKPGLYKSDDEEVIVTIDVTSFYPFLSIVNNFYPEHLGDIFCKIYKDLFDERKKHPKGSSENYALKIALNGVYGKSNSKFSIMYDPQFTLKITINGQLLLTMLAEELSTLGRLLLCNTDGLEIKIPRSKLEEMYQICDAWEALTGLSLEYDTYRMIAFKDVNNYVAQTENGTIKRKGMFRTYYDYTEEDNKPHSYDENPSATIIPEALCEYFVNDKSIEEYIHGVNNIYPFMYGIKGRKGFDYWLISADEKGVIDIEKRSERAIRFYMKERGANIYKFWKDDRKNNIQALHKGHLVETAMNITKGGEINSIKKLKDGTSTVIENYEVNKEFYINECYEIISAIEAGQQLNLTEYETE